MEILPDGVSPAIAALLVIVSYFTAALTAGLGIGGGILLLAVMSSVLPTAAVIPVHGVAQLGANFSRSILQRPHIQWQILAWFLFGALIGAAIGARVFVSLPEWALRSAIGVFILATVWGPKPKAFAAGEKAFFATGIVSTFITMFVGATGPIVATMLSTTKLDRLNIMATHAACMVVQHSLKALAFGFLGFAFHDWAILLAIIIAVGFAGSATGAHLLARAKETTFKAAFKYALTAMAFYLLTLALLDIAKTH